MRILRRVAPSLRRAQECSSIPALVTTAYSLLMGRAMLSSMADITIPPVAPPHEPWRALWLRTAARGAFLVVAYFVAWELFERSVLVAVAADLHGLHIVRGMGAAFLLSTWSFLHVKRSRQEHDAELRVHLDALEGRVLDRTRELERARALTELLFDSLRDRLLVIDASGVVIKANRVAERAAGGSVVGSRWRERSPVAAPQSALDGATEAGHVASGVHEQVDGAGRIWEVEAIAVHDASGPLGLTLEVGHDVTLQRTLEAQVRHQEKMASLGVLAAGVAHDLGNPLASLSTELELLEGEADVDRIRGSLDVLRRHVARMSRILRDMVDFARRRRDEISDVSVGGAIADSVRLVCHDPRWRRVSLEVDVPDDIPSVRMVEDHLVLVLVNLMLNAADAMPEGGRLTVRARAVGASVLLSVRDSGVGMSQDVLARACTPLFTTKAHGRGTGLGLAVSERIVRAIGGGLRLESALGEGTCVEVTLPLGEVGHG